jgi:hypothetical protein
MSDVSRQYRAGDSVEDFCRACKMDRMHTVVVADPDGRPLRVVCGYCDSEHNYRGGPRTGIDDRSPGPAAPRTASPAVRGARTDREAFPIVSERERTAPAMSLSATSGSDDGVDLEMLLRRVIREETGISPVVPAEKWRGGSLVLKPGNTQLQEKTWPIETFFHKIVMLRNRLRTLEQQINSTDLPEDVKVKVQGYISGCYGSLTSFNVLFANEEDQFRGSGGE